MNPQQYDELKSWRKHLDTLQHTLIPERPPLLWRWKSFLNRSPGIFRRTGAVLVVGAAATVGVHVGFRAYSHILDADPNPLMNQSADAVPVESETLPVADSLQRLVDSTVASRVVGESLLEEHRIPVSTYLRSAIDATLRSQYDEALSILDEGIANFEQDVYLHTNAGVLRFLMNDLDGAAEHLRLAQRVGGDSSLRSLAMSAVHLKAERYTEAHQVLREWNVQEETWMHAARNGMLGYVLEKQSRWDEAAAAYAEAARWDDRFVNEAEYALSIGRGRNLAGPNNIMFRQFFHPICFELTEAVQRRYRFEQRCVGVFELFSVVGYDADNNLTSYPWEVSILETEGVSKIVEAEDGARISPDSDLYVHSFERTILEDLVRDIRLDTAQDGVVQTDFLVDYTASRITVDGLFGTARNFLGRPTQMIETLLPIDPFAPYSVELWVNPGQEGTWWSFYNAEIGMEYARLESSGNYWSVVWGRAGNSLNVVRTSGDWQHIVLIRDDERLNMVLNGSRWTSDRHLRESPYSMVPDYQSSITHQRLFIAGSPASSKYPTGDVDCVRVWTRALSRDEVSWLFNEGKGREILP